MQLGSRIEERSKKQKRESDRELYKVLGLKKIGSPPPRPTPLQDALDVNGTKRYAIGNLASYVPNKVSVILGASPLLTDRWTR